ncbi:MAG: YlxR family protein [Actinomycetes bacterium]
MRVVLVEGNLVPDSRSRIAGRGAWLHPISECLDLAVRRRAIPRALRVTSALDVAAVRAEVDRRAAGVSSPSA